MTKGVLHTGIHGFLEGLDLGVGLSSIRLNTISSYEKLPNMRDELTSYPR